MNPPEPGSPLEAPIPRVKGTTEWLPEAFARLDMLERLALDRFGRAGYDQLSTPVLEAVELHERKSGAGIVAKLFELAGDSAGRVCLRPELTAGIVRAFTAAQPTPALPWRVSHAGPAFRHEAPNHPDRLREFRQVGVERLGDSGPLADAEVIWLAAWTLAEAGVKHATIRLGHVGLILEMLDRSGLPATAQAALVEMLSEAASEGGDVGSIERGLGHFADWLGRTAGSDEIPLPSDPADDHGVDRLFRTLVPVVTGRRSGHEIVGRLRRKWDMGHGLLAVVDRVRERVRVLSDLKGPALVVLDRLERDHEAVAPDSVAALRALVRSLGDHGLDLDRVELDLGFGRGIGFYSRMVFDVVAPTPGGMVEVAGGGRYDGLARVFGGSVDDRGVGFAFGLERLLTVLEAQRTRVMPRIQPTLPILPVSEAALPHAVRVATELRANGFRAVIAAPGAHGGVRGVRLVISDDDSLVFYDETNQPSPFSKLEPMIRLFDDSRGASS